MYLGFSNECINPTQQVELSGYGWFLGRSSEGVLDDIYARAVFLKDEDKAFLLINCDLLALSDLVVRTVKTELSGRLGISEDCIALLSIHTHTAPSVAQTIGCGEVNAEYVGLLIAQLIKAGVNAANKLYRVKTVKYGKQEVAEIGYNRANPENGLVDSNVYAVSFELEGHNPYIIMEYGCHPVILGRISNISADYPGKAVEELQKQGYDGVFLTGCCGDIDPVSNHKDWGSGTSETLADYGKRLVDGALSALKNGVETDSELDSAAFAFTLETERYSDEELDDLWRHDYENDANENQKRAAKDWILKLKKDKNTGNERVFVQVLRIGKALIIAAPGELVTKIGVDAREKLSEFFVLFCENANNAIRYVATDDYIIKKNYEGFRSNIVYSAPPLKLGAASVYVSEVVDGIRNNLLN